MIRRFSMAVLALALVLMTVASTPIAEAASPTPQPDISFGIPGQCQQGSFPSGALWMVCIPAYGWNGDLVLWAHGYTAFNEPIAFQNLTLPDGTYLPNVVQFLGYAFATTSYRENGLAILPGETDMLQLNTLFRQVAPRPPVHTYITGASEGGLITTLLVEQHPSTFSGGLALCGPIGNFRLQTDYFGNFRVLFDYFFPNVLPPSPINIPDQLINNWDSAYSPAVASAISANPSAAQQLIATSHAAIDPSNVAASEISTAQDVLWYNVFATNDAEEKLGGNPFDNQHWLYHGSANDALLNLRVERFAASPTALANLKPYETTGNVTIPLVTMHTTGDDVIPFWNEILYHAKIHTSGAGQVTQIPIKAYGHCNFTTGQVLAAFDLLVTQVTGKGVPMIDQRFNVAQVRADFAQTMQKWKQQGLVPQ